MADDAAEVGASDADVDVRPIRSVRFDELKPVEEEQDTSQAQPILVQGSKTPKEQNLLDCGQLVGLFSAVALPNAVLIVCASDVGIGLEVYNFMAPRRIDLMGNGMLCGSAFVCIVYYVLDWYSWRRMARNLSFLLPAYMLILGVFFKAARYPWTPSLTVLSHIPVLVFRIRASPKGVVVFRRYFYTMLGMFSMICAAFVVCIWAAWIMAENGWNRATKDRLIERSPDIYQHMYTRPLDYSSDCGPNSDISMYEKKQQSKISMACAQAATVWFMAWACPSVACFVDVVLAIFAFLHGVVLDTANLSRLERVSKQFVGLLVLFLMGMYVSVSIAGVDVRLGSALMAFFAASVCGLLIWAYVEIGADALSSHLMQTSATKLLIKLWASDWTRAIIIGGFNVLIPAFFIVDWCKARLRLKKERQTWIGMKITNELRTWNWCSIFLKVCMLGELFFCLQVGVAKLTYMFLSFLNERLASVQYGMVILMILAIGYTMFLLPPVPGIPVYIFSGIVLAEQGRNLESVGFSGGCFIAILTSFALKLAACSGQYCIGYFMGKSVKIQQLIGVDKVPTRAIEKILQTTGVTVGKVAVLVGGPDWPTSVTCGILKLSIPQMLLGTAPVIFVLAPCVLAGAFMARVKPDEESVWNVLANIFLGLSTCVQAGSAFMAVISVTRVIEVHGEDLAMPRKEHEAVARLTMQEATYRRVYAEVTAWKNLHPIRKIILYLATCGSLCTGFVFLAMDEYCFHSFKISSKIGDPYEKNGLNGNVMNIVKMPLGGGNLAAFGLSVFLHVVFVHDIDRLTKKRLRALEEHGDTASSPDAVVIGSSD